MINLLSLLSGIVFAVGLSISGMINPMKVRGFLDIFGNWDISLAFVMGGAVILNLFTFKLIRVKKPFLSSTFHIPTRKDLDKDLILGSAMFGVGWGLVGVCPGPALVNLVTGNSYVFLFVASMTVGMLSFKYLSKGR